MKNLLKYLVFTLIVLLIIQVISFVVFAEDQKVRIITKDLEFAFYLDQVDSISFYSNLSSSDEHIIECLNSRFLDTVEHIRVSNLETWLKHRVDSNYLAIHMTDTSNFYFVSNIYTASGTLYYGESWASKYVWVFYKWFRIKYDMTGIS